jgi:hypothetical protein
MAAVHGDANAQGLPIGLTTIQPITGVTLPLPTPSERQEKFRQ